ncbi:DnaB-like helicase C-terminal domain-containing protein [Candidatus Vidania fulgoroideorum]
MIFKKLKLFISFMILKFLKSKKKFNYIYKKIFKKVKKFKYINRILEIFKNYYNMNNSFEYEKFKFLLKKKDEFFFNKILNFLKKKNYKNYKTKLIIMNILLLCNKIVFSYYLYNKSKDILKKKSKISKIFLDINVLISKYFYKKKDNNLKINKCLDLIKKKIKDNSKNLINYIKTGFSKLDDIIVGFNPGDLIIIAGRPSTGKTAFCINLINKIYNNYKKSIFFCSLEMPKESILIRLISLKSKIDSNKIKRKKINYLEKKKIINVISAMKNYKIYISEGGDYSFNNIKKNIENILLKHKDIILISVDYLQLIQFNNNKENRNIEISKFSMYFKKIALLYKIPIILISQLNRNLESRIDKKPLMSDLKDSGSIEQDADIIIFLYKNNYLIENNNEINFHIAKNRNGKIGNFKLIFDGSINEFV